MRSRLPFPRVSAAAASRARAALEAALGPSKVRCDAPSLQAHAADESDQLPVLPDVVVHAASADDVRVALEVAGATEVPITPRAAGTGKSGGAVPVHGGVLLSMLGLDRIKDIDRRNLVATVEPGVVLADLHRAVEAEGLFYAPDPSSLSVCTLGGNVAENAAGPRAFKYGPTRDHVLGLELSLLGGTRLFSGKRTVKGVTGYDVTSLVVGSEGTLAVATEITLRLLPRPEHVVTLLALFADARTCGAAVGAVLAHGILPRCLELLDGATLDAVRAGGVSVDARARALLLIELDGDLGACERGMERVGATCVEAGALDVLVAQDPAQRDRLWEARRRLSPTTRAMARHKISEDVVVPRTRIPELLDEVTAISAATGVRMLTYGHAGDGNLHTSFLWDDPADEPRVVAGLDRLFRSVLALGGTLTGEHGVGTSKAEYLHLEQSAELIALQLRLKQAFDPRGLLNPGKIFPRRTHGGC